MTKRTVGLMAGALLAIPAVAGCASNGGDTERSASGSDSITVECYVAMRSGDEPVVWERDLPAGDNSAFAKAEEDCARDQSGGKLRTVD